MLTREAEQYRIDQSRAWLSQVRQLAGYEASMREAANAQYQLADGLKGIDYSRVNVTGTSTPDAIPNAIAARLEVGEKLEAIAGSAHERIMQAADALNRMDNKTEAELLVRYYLHGEKSWRVVCAKMQYSEGGFEKLKRRALLHAYNVMPHTERDPRYPAI